MRKAEKSKVVEVEVSFEFPEFWELQLGDYGFKRPGKCGCLVAKLDGIFNRATGGELAQGEDYWKFRHLLILAIGGEQEFKRLSNWTAVNRQRDRRQAYDALVRATEEMFGVQIEAEEEEIDEQESYS